MLISKTAPRKTLFWKIARHLAAIVAIVLLGGLLSATLVRLAPGFDSDERELDPGLSAESVRALRQSRAGEHNILRYYSGYLRAAWHGDLGTSHALGQPVQSLLRERWPVTLRVAGVGLLLAWLLALLLAFLLALIRSVMRPTQQCERLRRHLAQDLSAPLGDLRALRRVVEVGQAGVVELQVLAAQLAQPPDLLGVGRGQVSPERLEVRVDLGIEHGRPAPVVHHVR